MTKVAAPALFVLLWSTGFIAARFGLPHASPLTFLFYRFAFVAATMLAVALIAHARWPSRPITYCHLIVAGMLVQGLYLGGVFIAISRGMPAGTAAMLVGIQPVLTVFLARLWFGEVTVGRQWAGLAVGLVGVYLVLAHKVSLKGMDWIDTLAITLALAAISIGTLYQKRYCAHVDLRIGAVVQFGACFVLYAWPAWAIEALHADWTWQFEFALGWSVLVLSLGATSLLYWLLRHGAAADVARLFFLVPAVTMLMAYALFNEPITWLAVGGMVLIACGVVLARPPASAANPARS